MNLLKTLLSGALMFHMTESTFAGQQNNIIVDVRTPAEYAEDHVPNSLNIDFYNPQFLAQLAKLDRSKSYSLYCRSGNRSGQALQIMKQLGFEKVENLGSLDEAKATLRKNKT